MENSNTSSIKGQAEFNTMEFATELAKRGCKISIRTLEGWRISRNGKPAKLPAARKNSKGQAVYTGAQLEEVLSWKSQGLEALLFDNDGGETLPPALKIKPVIAAKAKEQQIKKPADSVLQKSAEQKPIDTRQEIAKVAGVSHDTIAKVEKIEQQATPEVNQSARAVGAEDSSTPGEEIIMAVGNAEASRPLEFKYFLKSRRSIEGAVPAGYVRAQSGEKFIEFKPANCYGTIKKTFYGEVVYSEPLTDAQIVDYDLAVYGESSADEEARIERLRALNDNTCAAAQIDSGSLNENSLQGKSEGTPAAAPQNSEITISQPSGDSDSSLNTTETAAPMDAREENSKTAQVETSTLKLVGADSSIPATVEKSFEDLVFEPLGGKSTETLIAETRYFLRNSVQSIIGAGLRLLEAKKRVPYGNWRQWVKDNIAVEYRTVANYMAIAEKFGGEKVKTFAHLSYSKCVALLPLNSDERTRLVEEQERKGKPVDKLSVRDLKKTVVEFNHREQKATPAPNATTQGGEVAGEYLDFLGRGRELPLNVASSTPRQPQTTPETSQQESPAETLESTSSPKSIEGTPEGKNPYTGNPEWYTAAKYIEAARNVMGGIDLDPASSEIAQRTVKATRFFTKETDGLAQEWSGRIWLNPPYAKPVIEKFVDKLLASTFEAAIVLVRNATETNWFVQLAQRANMICFTNHRLKFYRPDGDFGNGDPRDSNTFFYFGSHSDVFCEVFQQFGWFAKFVPVETQE